MIVIFWGAVSSVTKAKLRSFRRIGSFYHLNWSHLQEHELCRLSICLYFPYPPILPAAEVSVSHTRTPPHHLRTTRVASQGCWSARRLFGGNEVQEFSPPVHRSSSPVWRRPGRPPRESLTRALITHYQTCNITPLSSCLMPVINSQPCKPTSIYLISTLQSHAGSFQVFQQHVCDFKMFPL